MFMFCPNCKKRITSSADGKCPLCGSELVDDQGRRLNSSSPSSAPSYSAISGKHRNIVLSVILSVLTLGIYGLYWFCKLTTETNEMCDSPCANGLAALLFSIFSCGLYYIYWAYMMGKKTDQFDNASANSIVYLLVGPIMILVFTQCAINRT